MIFFYKEFMKNFLEHLKPFGKNCFIDIIVSIIMKIYC